MCGSPLRSQESGDRIKDAVVESDALHGPGPDVCGTLSEGRPVVLTKAKVDHLVRKENRDPFNKKVAPNHVLSFRKSLFSHTKSKSTF